MEFLWFEKNLVIALREVLPFFKKHRFYVKGLDINSRDGDYIVFSDGITSYEITIVLNPGFDILITKDSGFLKLFGKDVTISLKEEKSKIPQFSNLPDNFKTEDELTCLLKDYLLFLETYYRHILDKRS